MSLSMDDKMEKIPQHEGYLVEFKDFRGGISPKELGKTLCAFVNTEGGSVYLGVTDNRQITGVKITPQLLDNVQNTAREICAPPIPILLSEIEVSGKKVLKITVEKSGHLHSVSSGQTYVRIGTQDKRVLGEELLRLAESKSQISFEDNLLSAGMEAIDADALGEYFSARRAASIMRGNLSGEELLVKIGMARQKEGVVKISAGAFILFGKEHEQVLLQRDFTFVKYDIEGKMYSYREEISLPARRLLDRLMELIRPHNKITEGVRGITRYEKYLYPEDAVREALTNALAHRDYRMAGLKNECRLYPDRLEIISAGGLPSFITMENIDKRHYSRNPKIMHALLTLGITEELGQGINLMKRLLKANNNPPPEFIESSDQFKVIFRRPGRRLEEIDIKKTLGEFLSLNKFISRRQIENLLGIKSTRAKYLIKDLLKEGFLKKSGTGPATKYEKK